MSNLLTKLNLSSFPQAKCSMTSVPWPAGREDVPAVDGPYQVVELFPAENGARLKRYLLLTSVGENSGSAVTPALSRSTGRGGGLPANLDIRGGTKKPETAQNFSSVTIATLRESMASAYTYRECEAEIEVGGRKIGFRVGMLPNSRSGESIDDYSWWQWSRAERIWSGELAEAWRIGGHLVPYTVDNAGQWDSPEFPDLGDKLNRFCGDILHGDVYLIIWRSGLMQVTVHFKSAYFHTFPKEIPAFPVVALRNVEEKSLDFSPCSLMFDEVVPKISQFNDLLVIQPWSELKLLANRSKEGKVLYMPPEKNDVLPAGVSRTMWFNIGLGGVARYQVSPEWYEKCGVLETSSAGPAAELGLRNAELLREETHRGGIDTGRVWRYLSRWRRLNKQMDDGAEWEGNLAQAMFQLAYQTGQSPKDVWEIYLQQAYHAADISVYHGSWMGRLECTPAFTAPLPKFRFGGFLYGYLETGDPYLLELSRSLAGVYMAMEWALEPRSAIGRDTYPITNLMALYDYDPQPIYLDFAKQMIARLLSTQNSDGSFSAQAGAGVLTGVSCRTKLRDIHFGSGILSPIATFEWALRDRRWPADFVEKMNKWADVMLACQKEDGQWYVEGKSDEPYTLTGSATVFSLIVAGRLFKRPECFAAVKRYLEAMNREKKVVLGTHSFLSALYANYADSEFVG